MRDGGYVQIRGFLQFTGAFPTEEVCRSHLFSRRSRIVRNLVGLPAMIGVLKKFVRFWPMA